MIDLTIRLKQNAVSSVLSLTVVSSDTSLTLVSIRARLYQVTLIITQLKHAVVVGAPTVVRTRLLRHLQALSPSSVCICVHSASCMAER